LNNNEEENSLTIKNDEQYLLNVRKLSVFNAAYFDMCGVCKWAWFNADQCWVPKTVPYNVSTGIMNLL